MSPKNAVTARIDLIGGLVVLAGLGTAFWFGLLKADSAAEELAGIRAQQLDKQTMHSRLQRVIQDNDAQWQRLHEQARREGKLDDQVPIEQRLREFRQTARRHGWSDLQIMPLPWRRVEDVSEQSFTITAVAGYDQMLSLMREFEQGSTWADISHLEVQPQQKKYVDDLELCTIELTLNFYSSFTPPEVST